MNRDPGERLPVKSGLSLLATPMTRKQAERYGERHICPDMRAAGFRVVIFRSDPEIHGGDFFRVNYTMATRSPS